MKKWKELSREVVFEKYGRAIEKVDFEMPDGTVADFYIKRENRAVAIFALTPENDVIAVEEFRPGPMETLLEMPGGYVDDHESPLDAGKRELLEETGYQGDFEIVGECVTDAYSSMIRTVVIARNCIFIGKPEIDEVEFTQVKLLSLDSFREILRSGKMTNIEGGYMALDYLNLL